MRFEGTRQSIGSIDMAHRFSCSELCGIFLGQGSNPCPYTSRQILTFCTAKEVQFVHFLTRKYLSKETSSTMFHFNAPRVELLRNQPSPYSLFKQENKIPLRLLIFQKPVLKLLQGTTHSLPPGLLMAGSLLLFRSQVKKQGIRVPC